MEKDKKSAVLCLFALTCVAILLATSMVALVGNNNGVSSNPVTYEGLCGVANDDGNISSDSNTYVDNGFVISTSDDEDDDIIGEREKEGECSESNGETFWCNNLKYEIYDNSVKVVDYSSGSIFHRVRSFSVPDYIDHDGKRYTVTEIGEWAMSSHSLVGVYVPLQVEVGPELVRIRDCAFSGQFSEVRDSLRSFTIRNIEQSKLVEICDEAFRGTKIESIELPKSLQLIRQDAFEVCGNLETVILHSETLDIHREAFYKCEKLNNINLEKVRYIGDEAFYKTNLTDINLSSATEIGKWAIYSYQLHSVKFSPELTFLHEKAFMADRALFNWYFHFFDTHHTEMGQCAELMRGKTFVRERVASEAYDMIQVL